MEISNGHITLITPNTYLTLSTRENFREFLLSFSHQRFVYSGFCFEDAYVETIICELSGVNSNNSKIVFIPQPNDYLQYKCYSTDSNTFSKNAYKRFFVPTDLNLKLNDSINKPLLSLYNKFPKLLSGFKSEEEDVYSYINSIKNSEMTLLGLISEGEQGLVTGNNSKYIAQIINSKEEYNSINEKFLFELKKYGFENLTLKELEENIEIFYQKAEEIKDKKNKPDFFGKFFIYKTKPSNDVKSFSKLTELEKTNGARPNIWVNYYKGNPDGLRWNIPYYECILWTEDSVKELKEGIVTNSRWQGNKFFNKTGFAWVDYFTSRVKSFFVEEGIYSKNIVKLHSLCELANDKFIVACLNSKFISYYIKNFITTTHTLQINDGRLIPIFLPEKNDLEEINTIVDKILDALQTDINANVSEYENELDIIIYKLYGLNQNDIEIIEANIK